MTAPKWTRLMRFRVVVRSETILLGTGTLEGLSGLRMNPSALRREENASDYEGSNDRCSDWATEVQPAFIERFVKKISYSRSERSRQNESCPEQQHMRHAGREVEHRDDR